jgi:hypothetical protein
MAIEEDMNTNATQTTVITVEEEMFRIVAGGFLLDLMNEVPSTVEDHNTPHEILLLSNTLVNTDTVQPLSFQKKNIRDLDRKLVSVWRTELFATQHLPLPPELVLLFA